MGCEAPNLPGIKIMGVAASKQMLLKALVLVAATALGLGFSASGAADQERHYVLATADVGGTFYPVGAALATLIKVKLGPTRKIGMAAINSAGSGENVRLLRENKAQFALMAGLVGYYAWAGQGPFAADGPQADLRSVTALWQEADHFLIKREYAKTGTIEDMKGVQGKKVSLGLKGSGSLASNRFLLGNLGIDIERDLKLVYLNLEASARALFADQIEAMSVESGVPTPAVTLALTALGDRLAMLEFTDAQREKADGGLGLWTRYVIKAGSYPYQDRDIHTIGAPTLLVVRADVEEDAVYHITKTIFENLRFLRNVHKVFLDTNLDKALTGLPIPLHPGARRYYGEIGLDIPARLIAE